jgi:hypothetical protein
MPVPTRIALTAALLAAAAGVAFPTAALAANEQVAVEE